MPSVKSLKLKRKQVIKTLYSATDSILVAILRIGAGRWFWVVLVCFCIHSLPYFAWRLPFRFGSQFMALC